MSVIMELSAVDCRLQRHRVGRCVQCGRVFFVAMRPGLSVLPTVLFVSSEYIDGSWMKPFGAEPP